MASRSMSPLLLLLRKRGSGKKGGSKGTSVVVEGRQETWSWYIKAEARRAQDAELAQVKSWSNLTTTNSGWRPITLKCRSYFRKEKKHFSIYTQNLIGSLNCLLNRALKKSSHSTHWPEFELWEARSPLPTTPTTVPTTSTRLQATFLHNWKGVKLIVSLRSLLPPTTRSGVEPNQSNIRRYRCSSLPNNGAQHPSSRDLSYNRTLGG